MTETHQPQKLHGRTGRLRKISKHKPVVFVAEGACKTHLWRCSGTGFIAQVHNWSLQFCNQNYAFRWPSGVRYSSYFSQSSFPDFLYWSIMTVAPSRFRTSFPRTVDHQRDGRAAVVRRDQGDWYWDNPFTWAEERRRHLFWWMVDQVFGINEVSWYWMKQKEIQVVNPSLQLEPKITNFYLYLFCTWFLFLDWVASLCRWWFS